MFAPLVNCEAKKREYRCALGVFSLRTTEERMCRVRHGKISDDNRCRRVELYPMYVVRSKLQATKRRSSLGKE
jgi:hypothetical protein